MLQLTSDLSSLFGTVSPTNWAILAALLFLVIFYWYSTRYKGLWEKYNIPVPPSWPIINHYPKFKDGEEAPLDEWFKTYGDTFGTYGMYPHEAVLVTKDLKLLKHIMVKDFDNFMNKYYMKKSWTSIGKALFYARSDNWMRYRHVTAHIFSEQKLHVMMAHVTKSANSLNNLIGLYVQDNELIPVEFLGEKFAAEVIARIGFGLHAHAISKEESEFGKNARRIMRLGTPLQKWIDSLSLYFPPLFEIVRALGFKVDIINEEVDAYFTDILKKEIKKRRSEVDANGKPVKHTDVLDMYLDAEVPEGDPRLKNSNANVMTEDEIIANLNNLILGANVTIPRVLQAILIYLAMNQDVQDKVVKEVDGVLQGMEDLTFEKVHQLKYIEQVIKESVRLQPANFMLTRKALKTKTYDGWTIPAGANIWIPVAKILKDPAHWGDDPEKYDPDRFSPENCKNRDPMAFMAFSWGPRECVGQRFAMFSLKVVLATLLKKFRFELSERSEPKKGEVVKIVKQDIYLRDTVKPVMLEARPRK